MSVFHNAILITSFPLTTIPNIPVCLWEYVCAFAARLILKASEPIIGTASVALMWDYKAITLLFIH